MLAKSRWWLLRPSGRYLILGTGGDVVSQTRNAWQWCERRAWRLLGKYNHIWGCRILDINGLCQASHKACRMAGSLLPTYDEE